MTTIRSVSAIIACIVLSSGAAAGTISLTQGGWQFGGPLSVVFTGADTNGDGEIGQAELSAFNAVFLLPGGGSTHWVLSDINADGFYFADPGNYLFFASNPRYSLIDSAFGGLTAGSVVDAFLFPVDITDTAPVAVPEPAGPAVVGLIAILVGRRARRPAVDAVLIRPISRRREPLVDCVGVRRRPG